MTNKYKTINGQCYARHLNPDGTLGGWVAETAYVGPTVYVHPTAMVMGNTVINPEDGFRVEIAAKQRVQKTPSLEDTRTNTKGGYSFPK